MKQTTRIAIAGFLSASGVALQAIAAEMIGSNPPETVSAPAPNASTPPPAGSETGAEPIAQEAPKRRGRPAKVEATPAPEPVQEAEIVEGPAPAHASVTAPEPAEETESSEAKEARYQANRDRIKPLVEGGKGAAIKALLAKLAPTGAMKDLPLEEQPAFEKGIKDLLGDLEAESI